MIFDAKYIESAVSIDKKLGLYKIELPGIKRFFENIYYSYDGVQKLYGNKIDVFDGKKMGNIIIGISSFFEYKIICFIDLKTLSSSYFFVKSYDFVDIDTPLLKTNIFIYKDFNNKINFFTDYKGKDFSFEYKNNKILIKNVVFDSIVSIIDIELKEKNTKKIIITNKKRKGYVDIADFFIFEDYFVQNKGFDDFFAFLSIFSDKNIKINSNLDIKLDIIKGKDQYNPKIKVNLSILTKDILKADLSKITILFSSFFAESIASYLISNDHIKSYFSSYINDFTRLDFKGLDLNFKLPKNIFESDIKYRELKLNILKFRYNLFILKDSLKALEQQDLAGNNTYIKFIKNKLDMNKESLKIIIHNYEESFKKLLFIVSELYE